MENIFEQHAEEIARRIAGELLCDVRTVRREMASSGCVRGILGHRIRASLSRHRGTLRPDTKPPPCAA